MYIADCRSIRWEVLSLQLLEGLFELLIEGLDLIEESALSAGACRTNGVGHAAHEKLEPRDWIALIVALFIGAAHGIAVKSQLEVMQSVVDRVTRLEYPS